MYYSPSAKSWKHQNYYATTFNLSIRLIALFIFSLFMIASCSEEKDDIGVSHTQIQSYFEKAPWNFQFTDGALTDNQGQPRLVGTSSGTPSLLTPSAIEIVKVSGDSEKVQAVILTLYRIPSPLTPVSVGDMLMYSTPAMALGKLVTPDWASFEPQFFEAFGTVFTSITPATHQTTITHGNLLYEFGRQDEDGLMYLAIQHK